VSSIRHYQRTIYIAIKPHTIELQGERLKPLYEALHQEQVVRVVEQPTTPSESFNEQTDTENTPVVRSITWPDELSMEG